MTGFVAVIYLSMIFTCPTLFGYSKANCSQHKYYSILHTPHKNASRSQPHETRGILWRKFQFFVSVHSLNLLLQIQLSPIQQYLVASLLSIKINYSWFLATLFPPCSASSHRTYLSNPMRCTCLPPPRFHTRCFNPCPNWTQARPLIYPCFVAHRSRPKVVEAVPCPRCTLQLLSSLS